MNLLKDLWSHIKEWSDWKMKDWIKAAIVAIVVIWILSWFPKAIAVSDAAVVYSPFVYKKNKGSGPKGQTSNAQIKKVAFKGVK